MEKTASTKTVQRKKSPIVALKALGGHIDTLQDSELLTVEESNTMLKLLAKAKTTFIKNELG